MNIGRIGHFYDRVNGRCVWATVIRIVEPETLDTPARVNLMAVAPWGVVDAPGDAEGTPITWALFRIAVQSPILALEEDSFHLTQDCPWNR